jgi:Ca-activated chloride channel family protein
MKIRGVFLLAATVSLSAQFKSDVRLVEVYASVFDRKGLPVDDLKKDRFRVLDEGRPQPIVSFEQASDPLSCAILIDTTGSMRDSLGSVRNAVSSLLDQMRPEDAVAIYSFSTSLNKLQEFTTDRGAAKSAVRRTRAGGETALFDAISEASREIASRPGKKAIVLFTDGADNASRLVAANAINRALKTGIPIYAVAEGDAIHEGQLLRQLRSLATQTGGLCYVAKTGHDVAKVFADIQADLKHMYLLSYTPPKGDDTKWRNIRIDIEGASDYKIRGKQGYFPD